MDGLLAARIVSMICLGLVTWIIGIKGYHNWGLECSTVRIQHIRGKTINTRSPVEELVKLMAWRQAQSLMNITVC